MASTPQAAVVRTWLVTGCSSGLGRALCQRLLERGQRVVCTARDIGTLADFVKAHPERAIPLALDVTDADMVGTVARAAIARTAGIDVLVNNAGYGVVGALEEVDEDTVTRAFDANVYGAYRLTRAVLPHMRERKNGHILNISSMAGLVGSAGFCIYSATKFAVEGLSEALAQEVAAFGIKVTLIEPGPFRTDFRNRSMVCAPAMDVYADTIGRFRTMLAETDGKQPGDPLRAADAMIAVVETETPPLRLPLGEMCVQALRKKLASATGELDRWLDLSLSTAYGAAAAE